jgi:hypothetical protein
MMGCVAPARSEKQCERHEEDLAKTIPFHTSKESDAAPAAAVLSPHDVACRRPLFAHNPA